MKWKSLSHVQLFAIPWTIWSMEFFRPEYWSGWPFPSPGDLLNPGIKRSPPTLQAESLPAEPQGSPRILEWVAYPFSNRSSWSRNQTGVSCIAGEFFTNWAMKEAPYSSIIWLMRVHEGINYRVDENSFFPQCQPPPAEVSIVTKWERIPMESIKTPSAVL